MSKRGFTLVELLVVIAIIGILAAMFLATFAGSQAKSRDTVRKNDLAQIRSALATYYGDQGVFPAASATGDGVAPCQATTKLVKCATWTTTPPATAVVGSASLGAVIGGGYTTGLPAAVQSTNSTAYGYATTSAESVLSAGCTVAKAAGVADASEYVLEAELEKGAATDNHWQVTSSGLAQEVTSANACLGNL